MRQPTSRENDVWLLLAIWAALGVGYAPPRDAAGASVLECGDLSPLSFFFRANRSDSPDRRSVSDVSGQGSVGRGQASVASVFNTSSARAVNQVLT